MHYQETLHETYDEAVSEITRITRLLNKLLGQTHWEFSLIETTLITVGDGEAWRLRLVVN